MTLFNFDKWLGPWRLVREEGHEFWGWWKRDYIDEDGRERTRSGPLVNRSYV